MKNFLNDKKIDSIILFSTFIFFVFINLIYFYLIISNENYGNYSFNELFVNYQAGFLRRGLLGEIAWQLNENFLISPNVFFSIFFLFIHLTQFFIFFYLFKKYIFLKPLFILIFFSPSLLLFHIYSPELYFLKDSIIKIVFLFHIFIFYKFYVLHKNKEKYLDYFTLFIIPLLFITILIHEYQVFSLSLHFLITLGVIKERKEIKKILKIYSPLVISILLVLIFFGNETQFESLSEILNKFNVELNPYLGGGLYHYVGGFYKWHFYYFSYRDFVNLLFSFILGVLIFYVVFQSIINKKLAILHSKYQKSYQFYFFPVLIPFLLTSDHGRNIAFVSFYLVAFYSILNFNHFKILKLKNSIFKNLFKKYIILIFIFFYIFMWKLNQVAGFGLQGKPNDIFQSSLFAEIIKFIKYLYAYIDLNIISLPEIRL